MADKKMNNPVKEEKKIPVFTVFKNGSILKNIFLLDSPPSISEQPKTIESTENSQQSCEEILIVGRHPDCNIMLEHPSISRFHLRICSKPSLQNISVMDLSSAHGTWVSGQKIEPQVLVELNEGDTLRLGASKRIYRLHWMPLSQAFDVENRLVSTSDTLGHEEEEEEEKAHQDENSTLITKEMSPLAPPPPETLKFSFPEENRNPFVSASYALRHEEVEEEEDEMYQNENSTTVVKGMSPSASPSPSPSPETMNSWFPDENSMAFAHIQIPSAPPMPESMNSSSPDYGEGIELEDVMSDGESLQEGENQSPQRKFDKRDILSPRSETVATESVNSSFPVDQGLLETTALQLDKENQRSQVICSTEVLSERENQEMLFPKSVEANISVATESENSSFPVDGVLLETTALQLDKENQSAKVICSTEVLSERGNREILFSKSVEAKTSVATESVNSSLRVDRVLSEFTSLQLDEENKSPQILYSTEVLSKRENQETPLRSSVKKFNTTNLWSRRGKPASVLEIQMGKSRGKSVGAGNSVRTKTENQKGESPISRVLFPHLTGEEEIFIPDKENFSPNTLLLKSMRNVKEDEIMDSKLCRSSSSKITADSSVKSMKKVKVKEIMDPKLCRSSVAPEEKLFFSDKENQIHTIERKPEGIVSQPRAMSEIGITEIKQGLERVPFQSLLSNSQSKSRSEISVHNATIKSSYSVNCTQAIQENINSFSTVFHKESKKKWNMVVDTTSLLNKESRKSLMLLQGLKGTQLFIPRMVIRELDCLKRRGSFFRRESDVSSVLKWIEECMLKTKWWIHVQSSVEEAMPIAPTPPASPCLSEASNGGFAGGSTSSVLFSSFGSLTEIASPTAEDHILDCALLFKRIKIDEQLILLTSDVTLKIKAMAEGLRCETAEEFRASLVNPYSERFLWADSTPRGPTWSGVDDMVLRENYYKCPIKKSTPRGLKLILLHNSQYGQINSVN